MFKITVKEALDANTQQLMLWTRNHLDDVFIDNISLLNFYYASVTTMEKFRTLLKLGWDVNVESRDGVTLLDIFTKCYTDRPQFLLPLIMCGYNFRSSKTTAAVVKVIQDEYHLLFGEHEVNKVNDYLNYQSCKYYLQCDELAIRDKPMCDFIWLLKAIATLDGFDYVLADQGAILYSFDFEGLHISPATSIEFDADVKLYTPSFLCKNNISIVKELLTKFGYYYVGMEDGCMLINKGKSPATIMYKELSSLTEGTFVVRSDTECVGRIDGTKVSYYVDEEIYCDLEVIGDCVNHPNFEKKIKKLGYYVSDNEGEHYHLKKED